MADYNSFMEFKASNWTNMSLPGASMVEMFNKSLRSPSDEYFHRRVLQLSPGLDEPGKLVWELVVCLIPVWFITGLCIVKGVKSSGKVVYFTGYFPFLMDLKRR